MRGIVGGSGGRRIGDDGCEGAGGGNDIGDRGADGVVGLDGGRGMEVGNKGVISSS